MNYIKSLPNEDILKNSMYIFSESSLGTEFYNFFMKSHNHDQQSLLDQNDIIEDFFEKCKKNNYVEESLFNTLRDIQEYIKENTEYDDIESIQENFLYKYHYDRLCSVIESSTVNTELNEIVNNIQRNPEYMKKYSNLIDELKKEKVKNDIKYFPLLLIKNTSIFLGLIGFTAGVAITALSVFITLCLSVPQFVVAKLIDRKIERSKAQSYVEILVKQITVAKEQLQKEKDFEKKKYLQKFIDALDTSKKSLEDYIKLNQPVKELYNILEEVAITIGPLAVIPYILPVPKKWLRAFYKKGWQIKDRVMIGDISKMKNKNEIEKLIYNMRESKEFYVKLKDAPNIESKIIKYGVFNGVNAHNTITELIKFHDSTISLLEKRLHELNSPVKESIGDIIEKGMLGFGEDIDVEDELEDELNNNLSDEEDFSLYEDINESYMIDLYHENLYDKLANVTTSEIALQLHDELIENFFNFINDPEVNYESFNNMMHISQALELIDEAASTRKITHGVRKVASISDKVSTKVNKAVEPINRFVSELIDSFKKIDYQERRNRIIEGKFRFKLLKIVRDAVVIGGVAYFAPALAAIGFLVRVALDKKADKKIREQILRELKEEQEIVKEKIDDAKSDSERDKKYQLMRIKMRLDKEIERIEYNLDHN
jgi:hypothetical protein